MECPKCGNILEDSETSCKNCGTKVKNNTLNSISTGAAKTIVNAPAQQVPQRTEASSTPQVPVQQSVPVNQVPVQQSVPVNQVPIQQKVVDSQEYMMLQQQMASVKRKNNLALGIVIVLIAVTMAFGGFFLHKKLNANDSKALKSDSGNASKQITERSVTIPSNGTQEAEDVEDNKGNNDKKDVGSTDIQIENYIFSFPNNFQSKVQDGMGISIDYYNKIQFVYTVMVDTSYDSAVRSKEDFGTYLNSVGFKVNNYLERTYGNRKWLIYDGMLNNNPSMYAITSVGNNDTFQVTIYNLGGMGIVDLYTDLGKIIDNVRLKNPPSSEVPNQDGSSGDSNYAGHQNPNYGSENRTDSSVTA